VAGLALTQRVREFLLCVDVLDWDREAAQADGELRARSEGRGVSLQPLDMMIAAHALAAGAVLVTRDNAFTHISEDLVIEDWTQDPYAGPNIADNPKKNGAGRPRYFSRLIYLIGN
jgi:tRNA(fMet)-specific endonuclease VapC